MGNRQGSCNLDIMLLKCSFMEGQSSPYVRLSDNAAREFCHRARESLLAEELALGHPPEAAQGVADVVAQLLYVSENQRNQMRRALHQRGLKDKADILKHVAPYWQRRSVVDDTLYELQHGQPGFRLTFAGFWRALALVASDGMDAHKRILFLDKMFVFYDKRTAKGPSGPIHPDGRRIGMTKLQL